MGATFFLLFNPFHANDLFLYPLKKQNNQTFSGVLSGHRKIAVA